MDGEQATERSGWIGRPMRRREDARLLTGGGRYTDDIAAEGALHGVFLRSPFGHAEIVGLDLEEAARAPGVVAILTGADLVAGGYGPLPCLSPVEPRPGTVFHKPPRHALAVGHVRHVGEPIALVVAQSPAQAQDAAERIQADLTPLATISDLDEALAPGAPAVWPEAADNVALDWRIGDGAAVTAAFARAAHRVEIDLASPRLVANPLEPRAARADYDRERQRWTLHTGTQGVGNLHRALCASVLRCPPDALRVVNGDVGGGFGIKTPPYPEYVALLAAAKLLGRSVRWTADRSESFLADNHGRDSRYTARLALDADGRVLALQVAAVANMGAYLTAAGPQIATVTPSRCLSSVYRIPAMEMRVRCVFSHTAPVGPYRGAGRPEANLILETLMDRAAAQIGLDRIELRRRNLLPPTALPYRTPFGQTYDSGDFPAILEAALARADWAGFPARRQAATAAGRLRGIGLACYLESSGTVPQETVAIRFHADGSIAIATGAQSNGQGHATAFVQVVAQGLALPPDHIVLETGDSDRLGEGWGSVGSRSAMAAGGALATACREVLHRARAAAAQEMEVAEADLTYASGTFTVVGTDKRLALTALADARRGADGASALDCRLEVRDGVETFPNGCHVCEVEIDPETGTVVVAGYVAVDDFGTVLNPMIVDGQVQGGIAQGLGQVLSERTVYADGQLVTGSFLDYALPRTDQMPAPVIVLHPVPTPKTLLGVKGCGEAGTTGALAAGFLAVNDALAQADAGPIAMPATPDRVWRALHAGR